MELHFRTERIAYFSIRRIDVLYRIRITKCNWRILKFKTKYRHPLLVSLLEINPESNLGCNSDFVFFFFFEMFIVDDTLFWEKNNRSLFSVLNRILDFFDFYFKRFFALSLLLCDPKPVSNHTLTSYP